MRTESTDAVPEALRGDNYWYDTRTDLNGEDVLYDNLTSTYAYWNSTTHGMIITAVADAGNESVTDYFKQIG